MTWFRQLLTDENSIATTILVLSLTVAGGSALGAIRIRGVQFGVAGVLFGGLLVGHLGVHLQPQAIDFAREFGLVLFVYAVGMAVGPGFFNALRTYGARTNLFAVAIVLSGTLLAAAAVRLGELAPPIAVGVLAGATTNTPSLAAANQTLHDRPLDDRASQAALEQIGVDASSIGGDSLRGEVEKLPGLGYAVAYPGGVFGIILSFLILRRLFGVDPVDDARRLEREMLPPKLPLRRSAVRLTRAEHAGQTADQLARRSEASVVVSRIRRDAKTFVAAETMPLVPGDVLSVVGSAANIEQFARFVGEAADAAEFDEPGNIVARWIVISKRNLVGLTPHGSHLAERFGVRVTRVRRGDTELLSFGDLRLAFGDGLFAVGGPEGIAALAKEAGDASREVEEPHLMPMFVGIGLGVVIGGVPLAVPGLAAPLKIGLAGGPLLAALALSYVRRIGPLVFYLPRPANTALKELGIALFLAAVGIKAGGRFIETLTQGDGIYWLAWGLAITLIPLLIAGVVGIAVLRAPYTAVLGVLAGSMTDPPALAFANSLTKSEHASLTYATVYPTAMILRIVCAQVFLTF